MTTNATGPTPPAGFQLGNGTRYYELTTTATYSPPITVCISYGGLVFGATPQLFHYEGALWKDVTTSVDTVSQIVCGEVSSLSPFALFERINHAPVADAGPDQVVECGAPVTLDGSHSSDSDHDTLTYVWSGTFGTIAGATASVRLPVGVTIATLTVSDGQATSTDTVQITVRDSTPPVISRAAAHPSVLWPPNHKMTPVTVLVSASDVCDAAVRCRIVGVSSNEPNDGHDAGKVPPDWEITGDLTVNLRAERSGNGSTRIYTITVHCTDASNNGSTRTVNVTVPHNR
jgi:hypothetical protein